MDKISDKIAIEVDVSDAACIRCGVCAATCPTDVIRGVPGELPTIVYLEDCQACFLCQFLCPSSAIVVRFAGVLNRYRLDN
jgi:MinD superfamily P-loop ATPase